MKPNFHLASQSFVCLLLSVLFLIPMKGNAQSGMNTHPLVKLNPSAKTDVSAVLEHDSNSQKYTLRVINPSRRKLKISFYAGGTKYNDRASLRTFTKIYDLTDVDDGVYTFAIQDGKDQLKADVEIKTVYLTKREITFSPDVKRRGVPQLIDNRSY